MLNESFITYLWVYLIIPTRMCKEILRQLHEIHQGAVHTNQNTSGTTVSLNHVVRNEIKCDIVHWDDVGQSTIEVIFPA